MFRLETPGGGGYSKSDASCGKVDADVPPSKRRRVFEPTGSLASYKLMQESV